MFLGIYPFLLSFSISQHIIVHSSFLGSLYFCGISCNFSFITDFIYLSPLSFFLMSITKDLSILFIFSMNHLLVPWFFLLSFFFFFKIYWLIDWLIAMLGLRFCARAFSSCGKREPLFIAVCGPLTIVASLVAEHRLQTRRLSSCGSRAQLLRGMWDPPRPGLELVCPALAGRLSTTAPPGKPLLLSFYSLFHLFLLWSLLFPSLY